MRSAEATIGSDQRQRIDGAKLAPYLNLRPMALLPIITAPDPRLKIKARPVALVDDNVRRLMDDMLETMRKSIGIGLAAPQVGVAKRVIVVDVAREGEEPQPMMPSSNSIPTRPFCAARPEKSSKSLPPRWAPADRQFVARR